MCKKIQRQFKSMQKDPLAVIGLSWGLDLKRSGTELTIANQMDLGTELQRKCCSTSQDPVTRYSVAPVPWREENQDAKEEDGQQYTSMAVRKAMSSFSRWSSEEFPPLFSNIFNEMRLPWKRCEGD